MDVKPELARAKANPFSSSPSPSRKGAPNGADSHIPLPLAAIFDAVGF